MHYNTDVIGDAYMFFAKWGSLIKIMHNTVFLKRCFWVFLKNSRFLDAVLLCFYANKGSVYTVYYPAAESRELDFKKSLICTSSKAHI